MTCNGVNFMVLDSNKNLSSRPGVRTTKALTRGGPICAFVIRLLESIISGLASSEILIFQLVTVAERAGLNLTVRNPEDRVCRIEAHIFSFIIYGYS